LIFVHFPDVVVFDGQDHKSVGILLKEGFRNGALGVVAILGLQIIVLLLELGVPAELTMLLELYIRLLASEL
jgi:hypothetical protein